MRSHRERYCSVHAHAEMSDKPETNKTVIFLVVLTLAVNATIVVATLAYCLATGRELNAALLTAFVGVGNYVLGAISGMLVKTSPTEATKATPVQSTSDNPTPVQVVNTPNSPVPTEETKTIGEWNAAK